MLQRMCLTLVAISLLCGAARSQCIEAKFQEPASNADDRFGIQVLAHEDVVFVTENGPEEAGEVHVFTEQPQGWVELTSFAPATAWPHLHFGAVLAADGDVLLVGSEDQDVSTGVLGPGGAWIFGRDRMHTATPLDDQWVELQALQYTDPWPVFRFGISVALSEATALVGAPYIPGAPQHSAAYVFVRDDQGTAALQDDVWVQQARLDPAPMGCCAGKSVALMDAGLLALTKGDSGGVLQYARDTHGTADPMDDTWLPAETIEAPATGSDWLYGGFIVAGERLFAKGYWYDGTATDLDRIYVYERSGGGWSLAQVIDSPMGMWGPFGLHMAADGDWLVSGDHQLSLGPSGWGGRSALFERIAGSWTHVLTFRAPDESARDQFGRGVSLAGGRLFLGAPGGPYDDDYPEVEGAVYVMDLDAPNGWTKLSDGFYPDPVVGGWGCLDGESTVTVRVYDSMWGDTSAFLIVGLSLLDVPLFGEQLIPRPDLLVPIVLGQNGDVALTARWPASIPAGTSVWFQAWLPTGGPSHPWAVSNGLRATQPGD